MGMRTILLVASTSLALLLASGVAWAAITCQPGKDCRGNGKNNVMYGSRGNDRMYGFGGSDGMKGSQGDDRMYGGPGAEGGRLSSTGYMFGGGGHDLLDGGLDRDYMVGSRGQDKLYGRGGGDFLYGEGGKDRIFGGGGNDNIDTGYKDGAPDYVDCGAGLDWVARGKGDRLVNCEHPY